MERWVMRRVGNYFASVLDVLIGTGAMCVVIVAIAQWIADEDAEFGCECDEIM